MTTMTRALAALTTAILLHACLTPGAGTEGIDRTARPHEGTVRHVGSTPTVSTHPTRASRATHRTPAQARALTIRIAARHGYRAADLRCLLNLWTRESNFRPQALNRSSGAGGIPQILGLDPATPTHRQIQRGLDYIAHRYGSPCQALRHHDRHGWY